eukprot:TRINITY_DN5310_c2_g1_i1.p2 TRINITY_DN5310_c2_g1~~TRINITY_DN5310_c2_g1_i1.p2  ORF type:complete len:224 (-),score=-24.96 TRINITY_DN5310_c2_g1_i1:873-1544(-)
MCVNIVYIIFMGTVYNFSLFFSLVYLVYPNFLILNFVISYVYYLWYFQQDQIHYFSIFHCYNQKFFCSIKYQFSYFCNWRKKQFMQISFRATRLQSIENDKQQDQPQNHLENSSFPVQKKSVLPDFNSFYLSLKSLFQRYYFFFDCVIFQHNFQIIVWSSFYSYQLIFQYPLDCYYFAFFIISLCQYIVTLLSPHFLPRFSHEYCRTSNSRIGLEVFLWSCFQ